MTWDGMHQRKFPRAAYKCLIRVLKTDGRDVLDTFTENIGSGGICVVLSKQFELFEKVGLQIFLGGNDSPILCDGTVVWVVRNHPMHPSEPSRFDTGIEFSGISSENTERIGHLVKNLLKSDT